MRFFLSVYFFLYFFTVFLLHGHSWLLRPRSLRLRRDRALYNNIIDQSQHYSIYIRVRNVQCKSEPILCTVAVWKRYLPVHISHASRSRFNLVIICQCFVMEISSSKCNLYVISKHRTRTLRLITLVCIKLHVASFEYCVLFNYIT